MLRRQRDSSCAMAPCKRPPPGVFALAMLRTAILAMDVRGREARMEMAAS